MSSWQDDKSMFLPSAALELFDGTSPDQGRPAHSHLILRCFNLPRSKVLGTLLRMWEASASLATGQHDLPTLSLCSVSFPQSFLASSFQKNSIPVLAEFSGKELCQGDRARSGRGWELVVYTSLSLDMEGFRGKGSQCFVSIYYESSSFKNNLASHIMQLRLRKVVTCPK